MACAQEWVPNAGRFGIPPLVIDPVQILCTIVSRMGDLTGSFVMVKGLLDGAGV